MKSENILLENATPQTCIISISPQGHSRDEFHEELSPQTIANVLVFFHTTQPKMAQVKNFGAWHYPVSVSSYVK